MNYTNVSRVGLIFDEFLENKLSLGQKTGLDKEKLLISLPIFYFINYNKTQLKFFISFQSYFLLWVADRFTLFRHLPSPLHDLFVLTIHISRSYLYFRVLNAPQIYFYHIFNIIPIRKND